jgi:hypothetical protein
MHTYSDSLYAIRKNNVVGQAQNNRTETAQPSSGANVMYAQQYGTGEQ